MLAKFKPLFLVVMIVLALAPCAQAQEEVAGGADAAEYQPVPRQFRTLALGMPLDELRSVLTQDRLFAFRGERDVSFLPVRQETLVETAGNSFIRRAHFQLTEGEVFIMSFTLDTRRVDHYSVFMTFVNRYGQPVTLNPAEAVWEDDSTRVSIERPLTVKYIDLAVFRRLQEESQTLKAGETLLQERFLNEF
ncbi:MAG: hypothetical protein FWD91_05025 [Treponema sp.]|nr:hypothetical protein [Treponema sp.]